jgi:hypothetical protein
MREVADRMRESLPGYREFLALIVAIAALLGAQALSAAPAQAWLTDTEDCPACGDGGAPAGDDGGASANDSGGASDAAPSPGDGSDNSPADKPETSSETANTLDRPRPVDPMALTDPPKYPAPAPAPVFNPFSIAPSGTVSWASPLGKCNLLVAHIVHAEEWVEWLDEKIDVASDALDRKSISAVERRMLHELGDHFASKLDDKRRDLHSYRRAYGERDCDLVYASAAGF